MSTERGRVLTRLARASIARTLGVPVDEPPRPDWLKAPGAVFVTLTRNGELRGCIGSLEARRSLEGTWWKTPAWPPSPIRASRLWIARS